MRLINRKIVLWSFLYFLVLSLGIRTSVLAAGKTVGPRDFSLTETSQSKAVPDEVIVKFKKDKINLSSTFSLSSQLRKLIFNWTNDYEMEETLKSGNLMILKIKPGESIDEVIKVLTADSNVEYVQPNYKSEFSTLSIDDTHKANLWGLENYGQTITKSNGVTASGTSGADIDLRRAWDLSMGSTEVVVAVIDSGVAYNHPDLVGVMWDGTSCKNENGNAMGGCLHGFDYGVGATDNDPLPTESTHGTHVAGTIAAARNNTKGITGISPNIKIMALKSDLWTSSSIKAIDFAIQNGAKIINASWTGSDNDTALREAIDRFRTAGGIFVAAAGNEAADNETTHSYPSDYDLDNIISVAATDQNDLLASFSNFGGTSVDVAAPGVNIFSTVDEAALIDYSFNTIDTGSLPTTWTSDLGSSWGVLNGVVWSDYYNLPYTEGVDSLVTSDTLDLSTVTTTAKFYFETGCDTEINDPYGIGASSSDYMTLETSGDGTTFTEIARWNEYSLQNGGGVELTGISGYGDILTIGISAVDFTSNFKYRLRWVTDSDSAYGSGNGCYIENFKILTYTDGTDEQYDFMNGTSMAAPHVAGLAGYLWSIDPGASMSEIIANILSNGDTLPSLATKTVTGRRINAYNSVLSLGITIPNGPTVTGLSDDAVPAKSKIFTWSSDNPGTDLYRFSIDQSISGVPTGSYGVGNSTAYASYSGTFYIHVQAKDQYMSEGAVVTASFILDNTGPLPIISSSSLNSFLLAFGENLYSNVGTSLGVGFDLSAWFTAAGGIGISTVEYGDEQVFVQVSGTPLAGSNVNLLSGTAATNFYDYLTNAGSSLTVYFNGNEWRVNPSSLNVATSYFPDLITTGLLSLGGSAPETATSITTTNNLTITIGETGSNSSVGFTLGTIISELNDAEFNANLISGTEIDPTTVSGLEVGYTALRAIQWGLVGSTLKFNQPVTINLYIGSSFDGQSLNVYRSESLSVGWTSTGLSTSTCTVSGGYCSFATTEASYFMAAASSTPTPTSTPGPTSTPSNNNNQTSGNDGPPGCNDRVPVVVPDLFRISTSKGSAKIIFTPVNEKITGYAVMYGHKKGDERYAAMISPINNNIGEQSFTINKLNPKITYYFKVTAFNGCVSGPWSDWIPAKADRKREIHKYKTVIKNKIKTLVSKFI